MTTNEPPAAPTGVPLNRKALYSVVLGSAAFAAVLFVWFLGFVLAVPAVTCAVHGRREIKDSQGSETGDMLAVIGLTIGATTLGLLLLSWVASSVLS